MLIISWAIALIAIMIAGMWAGRALESSRQFTGADRSYGAIGVGCMLAAVQIGGMSMIGAAQNGYNIGIAGAWYSVSGCCYFFVMIACVKALYKKMPGVSLTQYLGMRYGKINARIYVVIYLVYAVLYVPIQLQTCVGVLQIVVPQLSYNVVALIALFLCVMYTGYAGMKGANTVGKIICLGTYAVLIVFIFVATGQLGGISGVLDALPASYSDPFQMKTTDILAYAFGNVFTYFGFQSFMQPMLAAKDVKTARRGLWIGWARFPGRRHHRLRLGHPGVLQHHLCWHHPGPDLYDHRRYPGRHVHGRKSICSLSVGGPEARHQRQDPAEGGPLQHLHLRPHYHHSLPDDPHRQHNRPVCQPGLLRIGAHLFLPDRRRILGPGHQAGGHGQPSGRHRLRHYLGGYRTSGRAVAHLSCSGGHLGRGYYCHSYVQACRCPRAKRVIDLLERRT